MASCRLCAGTGLVSHEAANRWQSAQTARSSTTTHSIAALVAALCVRLDVYPFDSARELSFEGRLLLAVIESWRDSPAPGPVRVDHYRLKCAPWIERALAYLRACDGAP